MSLLHFTFDYRKEWGFVKQQAGQFTLLMLSSSALRMALASAKGMETRQYTCI